MTRNDRDSGDRPTEIEVSPAMIDAGVLALYAKDNDPMFVTPEKIVARVFAAMVSARDMAGEV